MPLIPGFYSNNSVSGITMPPKVRFSKNEILKAAKKIIEDEKIDNLNARKIASYIGSSVAPLYTQFESVDDLKRETLEIVKDDLIEYCDKKYSSVKLVDFGIGMVFFAMDHKNQYAALYSENGGYAGIIGDFLKRARSEIKKDKQFAKLTPKQLDELLNRFWIFSHGLASLAQSNMFKLKGKENTIQYIQNMFNMIADDVRKNFKK